MAKSLTSKRESNIELLRVVAILMVISLHMCQGDDGFLRKATGMSLWGGHFIYNLSLSAVDIFLIISGYFSVFSSRRILGKPLELICICVFFKVAYYLFFVLLFGGFEWIDFIRTFIPDNYFVNIFCVCYILSPYINKVFLQERKKNLTFLLTALFVCFSIWPTIANVFLKNFINPNIKGIFPVGLSGTDQGFTLVNFLFCYSIGAYTKITNFSFWKNQKSRIVFLLIILFVFTYLVLHFPFLRSMTSGLDSYDSIFVIIIGWTVFMIFRNLSLPYIGFVNYIAKSTFGVYIIHTQLLWIIEKYVSISLLSILHNSIFNTLLFFLVELFLSYFICICLYKFLGYVFSPFSKRWRRSRFYNFNMYTF